MSESTTVVSVRGKDRDALLADPLFCYVGREVYRGGMLLWKGSKFGNPFKVGMKRSRAIAILGYDPVDREIRELNLDLRHCLFFFRAWLKDQPLDVGELAGKRLGCWCADWSPGQPSINCHAYILAKAADMAVAASREAP